MRPVGRLITTAEALRRVFVPAATETCSSIIPLQRKFLPCNRPSAPRRRFIMPSFTSIDKSPSIDKLPSIDKKPRYFGPKQPVGHPRDEFIHSYQVRIVDENGLREPEVLNTVLSSIDRAKFMVLQVSPPSGEELPVCKIVDKVQHRLAEKAKHKPNKNPGNTTKRLELGWSIAPNDFNHRMKKMKEFLGEGRKVEIVLAPKKNARNVDTKEAALLLESIRAKIKEVPGAKESKVISGEVGKLVTMYLEGKAQKVKMTAE